MLIKKKLVYGEEKAIKNIISFRFGPYFVEPIVAGFERDNGNPYVSSCDLIGCTMTPGDFVVGGTCSEQLYGKNYFPYAFYSTLPVSCWSLAGL